MSLESDSGSSNSSRTIIIILVIVALCCLCLFALFFLLPVLFGPSIGNVFSDIIDDLEAAVHVSRMI